MKISNLLKQALLVCTSLGILAWFANGLLTTADAQQRQGQNTPQTNPQNEEEPIWTHIWEARMRSGNYMVNMGKISAVGLHEYISDGAARVVEVTVCAESSVTARFYYLEPVTANSSLSAGKTVMDRLEQLTDQAAKRAGAVDGIATVTKNYPTTTHAHTIEFRLKDESQLISLYSNLTTSIKRKRGNRWVEPN